MAKRGKPVTKRMVFEWFTVENNVGCADLKFQDEALLPKVHWAGTPTESSSREGEEFGVSVCMCARVR